VRGAKKKPSLSTESGNLIERVYDTRRDGSGRADD
jgi:hypothetical protein